MEKRMKAYVSLMLALLLAGLTGIPVYAKLAPLDPDVRDKQLAQAGSLYAKRDVDGLLKLLKEAHLFIKTEVALKLGRLGADDSLPILREYDERYSRFACSPSGEFGVAVILIESKAVEARKKALLAVATEPGAQAEHAHSVIDAAGRELSRFDGDDMITALAEVNTYGAQYTVLELQCRKLSRRSGISKCIAVLEAHETPQKAEAAQDILVTYGARARSPVEKLKDRMEEGINATDPTFTIPKTIRNRCARILKEIQEDEEGDRPAAVIESMWFGEATQPVPEGAKVRLELDRPECLLGENVLVHFVLQNTGDTPFEASWGGDYRGASRHLRFKVTATDEAGQATEDPDPAPMCMGGLGGSTTLGPGESFTTSLPLMRYCDIVKPGVYRIEATHDFGWTEGERERPVGEATMVFRRPNAEQAKRIAREMAEFPNWPNSSWGERSAPYADFRCLRHPVYLDILAGQVRDGEERALEGLGLMPTVQATETLIQLAGCADEEWTLKAANTLNRRLPHPESHYVEGRKSFRLSMRGRLVARAWDDELVPEVRALAARLLASEDLPTVAAGAFMVVCVGTKEDAPAVLAAINKARNPTHRNRTDPKDNILNMPQPIRELLRAIEALGSRGYALGEHVSGEAEILVYFHVLRDDAAERPDNYRQLLEAFGTSSWFVIREAAVRSIPKPLPAEYREFVLARLEDKDLGVCRAACSAAAKSGDARYLRPLLDLIATEHHEWLLREASNAAHALDAGFALLSVWAERLAEKHLYSLALDTLQTVLEVPNGGHSGRTDLSRAERLELRRAWKEFLALHGDEIRRGRRFSLDDAAVTGALVGRARWWQLPDGTSWPASGATVTPD